MYSNNARMWSCLRASLTLPRRNFKTKFSLWNHIKCFPSTPDWLNLKTGFSLCLKNASIVFRPQLRWKNLKPQQPPVSFIFVLEEHSLREITWFFEALLLFKNGVFKLLGFEERYRIKAPSSWRIMVDIWPNRRNKAPQSRFFLV